MAFDLIASYLSDEPRLNNRGTWPSRDAFMAAIQTASQHHAAGSIPNPIYGQCKDTVNRSLEIAFDAMRNKHNVDKKWFELCDLVKEFDNIVHFHTSVSMLAGAHRRGMKLDVRDDPYVREATAFLCDALPLAAMFADLKIMADQNLADKRQTKAKVAAETKTKTGYVAPMVSNRYQQTVVTLLEGVTLAAYDVLKERIRANINVKLKAFIRHRGDSPLTPYEFFVKQRQLPDLMAATIVNKLTSPTGTPAIYRVIDDAANRMLAMAKETADEYRTFFVHKNFRKIASIIEGKGGFKTAETVSHLVSLEGMEGIFRFTFRDGSCFTVINKTVGVVNSNGTRFIRYPLTFHAVVLPDGRKMNKPSQARMNEVFAKFPPGRGA
jgi:hypothetical protein